MASLFDSSARVFTCAVLLRVVLLFYGLYQDAHSPMKYTDIDYMVFTDAARYVSHGRSPYARDTYRYTPLLAWLLVPTSWGHGGGASQLWFSFGKALFAAADVVAGWLILQVLRKHQGGMETARALKYASIWLLNPMVATISTRGSSEGLLGVLVVALLWAVEQRRVLVAGTLLGLGVHFKIYPFIYGPAIIWKLDDRDESAKSKEQQQQQQQQQQDAQRGLLPGLFVCAYRFVTPSRLWLGITAISVFAVLNLWMYALYGLPFVQHTYLHHLTRIDHRHNFSPYNILLYLSSSQSARGISSSSFESLAFIPQLALSAVLIPLVLARKDLAGGMLAQTFAFVTLNKVCTSQYFLWYIVLLPLYLPYSSFIKRPLFGISAAILWVVTQALWLQQGFQLEFLGLSSFFPGLYLASLAFFAVNIWILGVIVADVGSYSATPSTTATATRKRQVGDGRRTVGSRPKRE